MIALVECDESQRYHFVIIRRNSFLDDFTDSLKSNIVCFDNIQPDDTTIICHFVWSLFNGIQKCSHDDPNIMILPKKYVLTPFNIHVKVSNAALVWYSKVTRYDYLSLGCIKYFKSPTIRNHSWFAYHAFVNIVYATHNLGVSMDKNFIYLFTLSRALYFPICVTRGGGISWR